ncbi:MAG: DNA replication protein DnaD [Finegoldia magna]|uniref:DNA replication protein DnaD n=1 Tax=Finegoldia magna TaxID=1260 RepID=UPI0029154657|nr:DNA replication protein DnaD [Finegoldia magna]MDU7032445.1 DNA replication protein DnaD [Finegoldia magna]
MAYGWISIHRKIQDNIIWNDKPFNRGAAWIDLIMLANHENKKIIFNGSMVEIKRGEKITSLRKLSERWGWSRGKTKKFLNLLKDENMIEFKTDHQKTTYKIVNYNVYQNEDLDKRATEKPLNDQQKATEKPLNDTNNNINNYNNVNNNNCVGQSELNLDDPKLAELIKLYQDCGFGLISPYSAKVLSDYMNAYSFPWVKEAIQIAEQNNIRTLAYINGILKKKKAGTDKPRNNNFKKKETYYRPKQEEVKQNNQFNSFAKMQEEFKKMRENNGKI